LRVYGHEFLAQRSLVQLSLGHPFSRNTDPKPLPVKLYSRSGEASLHMWSSLKLVMTSKSDITAVPHSVILPLADEREVFSFQVANLDKFTLELSLYPTFGSKVIGRTVVLPSTFKDIRHHKGFIAPLLDHQLKTIGEVAFEVSCIKPFEEAQLEIGGRVETYWKSKVTPSAPTQDHAHQLSSHRPLSVSTSSPALRPPLATLNASTQQGAQKESALVTASSLSGEYIHISVQLTKDGIPVVYPSWKLPVSGLDVGVSDVTYAQFEALARSQNRELSLESGQNASTAAEWYALLFNSMSSLENVLRIVPLDVGLNVQLKYLREFDSKLVNVSRSKEVNEFVDPILHDIYQAGKNNPGTGRKIIFSSFDPTICTALNWKQPNCG
jgi:CDK inhibitor PHO81